jgi:membrane fusion protein (multidrug efflux system)
MKKTWIAVAIIVAIIVLLALPKLDFLKKKDTSGISTAPPSAPKLQVEALVMKPSKLEDKLIVTGSILPNESLELRSETSGKIAQLLFQEGKSVRKGDLLLRINDEELEAELTKQRYNRKLNQDVEFRQRKLLEKDAVSREEYDNALNRLKTTEADIKVLEAQLEKTRIRAPFDGTIGLRYVSDGAYLTPSTIVATLYSMNPAKLEFAVPSRYSSQVTTGKKIRFTVEGDTNRYEGEVYATEPRIDQETRTLKIRAIAENKQGLLLPGQFVKVDLILQSITNALLVPTQAVIPEQAGKKVFLYRGGKAIETKIETGIRTERDLEVLSGLNPEDTVITTGMLQLRNGMDVQIVNRK